MSAMRLLWKHMFYECNSFKFRLEWDVKNMSLMFYDCSDLNSDISRWDVSDVVMMDRMFSKCKKFNSYR